VFPFLQHATKNCGGPPAVASPGQTTASTIIGKDSPTPVRQDKQMPNTALELLDTMTEPEIAIDV
jgi:hypothetical protein